MGILRAEWLKLRTVRSNLVLLGFVLVLGIGFGALATGLVPATERRSGRPNPDLVNPFNRLGLTLAGLNLAMVLVGVFGVHLIGQEYRFNTIRATFAAVPRRMRVVGSKLVVLLGTSAVVGAVTIAIAIVMGRAILSSRGFPVDMSLPATDRIIIGVFLLVLVYGLAGYGVGLIVRQPIGGIVIVLAFPLIVDPLVANLLKSTAGKWMPYTAGQQILEPIRKPDYFGPWAGFFYFLGFAVLLCVIGTALANRRDA